MRFMERNTFANALPDLSRPLVIFKIGILGCMPIDTPELIADEYDAYYIESEIVRDRLMFEDLQQGIIRSENYYHRPNRVNNKLIEIVASVLKDGDDVIIDKFYNTQESREKPLDLARKAGALSVALLVHTSGNIIDKRVSNWTLDDAFPIPVSEWAVAPAQRVHNMRRHLQLPSHDEGIDFVFPINGNTDSDGILRQFDGHLQYHDLAS